MLQYTAIMQDEYNPFSDAESNSASPYNANYHDQSVGNNGNRTNHTVHIRLPSNATTATVPYRTSNNYKVDVSDQPASIDHVTTGNDPPISLMQRMLQPFRQLVSEVRYMIIKLRSENNTDNHTNNNQLTDIQTVNTVNDNNNGTIPNKHHIEVQETSNLQPSIVHRTSIRDWPFPYPYLTGNIQSAYYTAGNVVHIFSPGACWFSVNTLLIIVYWIMMFITIGIGAQSYHGGFMYGDVYNPLAVLQLGAMSSSLVAGPSYDIWRYFVASILSTRVVELSIITIYLLRFGYRIEYRLNALRYIVTYFSMGVIGWLFTCLVLPSGVYAGGYGCITGTTAVSVLYSIYNFNSIENKHIDIFLSLCHMISIFIVSMFIGESGLSAIGSLLGGLLLGGLSTPNISEQSTKYKLMWYGIFGILSCAYVGIMIGVLYSTKHNELYYGCELISNEWLCTVY